MDVVLFEGWMLGFNSLPHINMPVHPNPNRCPDTDSSSSASMEEQPVGTDGAENTTLEKCTVNEEEEAAFELVYNKARNIQVQKLY